MKRCPRWNSRCRVLVHKTLIVLLMACWQCASADCPAADAELSVPSADQILKTLRPERPRLLLGEQTLDQIRSRLERDPHAQRWYDAIRAEAVSLLRREPSRYEIPDGRRLLSVSRRVNSRAETLGLVFLLEGDPRFAERLWQELEAAAAFKDLNPSHLLDTAEMTYGLAIGYDWLYGHWTDAQRQTLREAIVQLGLQPGLQVYNRDRGWHTGHNNWNQVCNGGLVLGALAVAEDEPDLAGQIVYHAVKSVPLAMAEYRPDGAGTEGVTYWSYGSRYNVLMMEALETALGTDFGLADVDGFAQSGDYHLYLSGADRVSFNFADCGVSRMSTPQHTWMGRRYGIPRYSWFRTGELADAKRIGGVFDLLWYDDSGRTFDPATIPLDKHFRHAETASMRSSWADPRALVLAVQAGDTSNLGNHRHLDLGSFILEADGVRWAIDSGTEGETYQSHRHHNPRWHYYRIRAEGHNTLVFNPGHGPDQDPKGVAKIVEFQSRPAEAKAVIDLTPAYAEHAQQVTRSFAMLDRKAVLITDQVAANRPNDLWWFMHTTAEVKTDGSEAVLTQDGKRLLAKILAPPDARFDVLPAAPFPTSPNPEKQASNADRRKLAIHLPDVANVRIEVRLTPEGSQ